MPFGPFYIGCGMAEGRHEAGSRARFNDGLEVTFVFTGKHKGPDRQEQAHIASRGGGGATMSSQGWHRSDVLCL